MPVITHNTEPSLASRWTNGPAIVLYIAVAKLLLHLLTANRYGYFGDELYHLACGEHLDWGYVDQPPLIAVIAWLLRHTIGTSLFAIHLLPALSGAVLVWLTGVITRELGGQRFAQALAALSVACMFVFFVMHRLFTMNAWEPLFWMGCAYLLIRIIKTGNQKLWLGFGVLAGIGMENKYSMAVFGFGVVVGLLLTPARKVLAQKWIPIGGGLAFLIFLPNLIWNIQHQWPFLELMRNIRASGRDIRLSPAGFMLQQTFLANPILLPLWVIGTLYLLFSRTTKPFRVLGWTFLTVVLTFMLLKGKAYYAMPVYPIAVAAGGIAAERFIGGHRASWLKPTMMAAILVATLACLPIGVPVLSIDNYLKYQAKLPFKLPTDEKSHLKAPLPHYYAWSFGWEDMVAATARAYTRVPPEERAQTAIWGSNFAEAGAIDLLGPKYGLPKAIGGHQSYWLWGPRNYTGEHIIVLGDTLEDLQPKCNQVEVAAELNNRYARPGENGPVLICHGLKWNLQQVWPRVKDWD
jgi:hypothetical protein